ncbi:hypothetical protein HMPREF1544_11798 [Mucor circinelloides 1006PhL]|uniref:MHD domain-containing protein n=1 Tax=Mucor circinelloides f. circinelloides (strain 1006PhL) TaxID=1220926 RepID=S2IVY5_MUCC1|nr:hypothetical protein HMPREF1544_11798 [Mucor circinelloides 1006PhL]
MAHIEERNSYIQSFLNERPKNGIDIPHARLLSALKLNDEFAEYFKDRAQIEDMYAKSIMKLQKKNYIANKPALGTFLPLWEMLQIELAQLASIHGEYSTVLTEQIEQPLRAAIPNNRDYADIHKMGDHMQRIAREYDDLESKIQKQKKNSKGEAKLAEYIKLQEQKLAEWNKDAPEFLQKHQKVNEFSWENLKTTIYKFESIQQTHAEKMIEMTGNTMTAAANLRVDDEIAAFCASHGGSLKITPHRMPNTTVESGGNQAPQQQLINTDNIVPEPSVSDMSLKSSDAATITHHPPPPAPPSIKKDKKRFFSSLVSIRRKPKSDANLHQHIDQNLNLSDQQSNGRRQRSFSNAGSFVESSSLHSINTHSTSDHHDANIAKSASANNIGHHQSVDLIVPNSPNSLNPPSINNAPSLKGSFTNDSSSQPPLILIDAEGYSIPPPDRAAWHGDANTTNESLVDTDDMASDGGSVFSNPRIRVDIKNEAVVEEDASQSAVALSRVSTLLREKTPNAAPAARRLRGRREMRATQLYSVIEQDQIVSKVDGSSGAVPLESSTDSISSLPANPFEMSQEKIAEIPEEEDATTTAAQSVEDLPLINVYITETVHVLSRAGEAEKSVVWGEIGIDYRGPAASATPICFQINHQQSLDSIETTDYADVLDGYTLQDNIFKINTQLYHENVSTLETPVAICIKYQTKLDHLPITVKPIWKCEADKSRLLVKYHSNVPATTALNKVMFVTSVTGNVQNALSIPAGELVLSQNRIKWHLGQISDNNEAVIKAQFTTLEQASPQPIAVRFEMKDHLLSDVNVEQGADALVLWAKICNTTKIVKAGKYIADI